MQRQAPNFTARFNTVRALPVVRPEDAFYCSDWPEDHFPGIGALTLPTAEPERNIALLLQRVQAVVAVMRAHFPNCSGVYPGKTTMTRISGRASSHVEKVDGQNATVIMVTLARFTTNDIHPVLQAHGIGCEQFTLTYETMLTEALVHAGIRLYNPSSVPGGGRIGTDGMGILYMMMVVSHEPLDARHLEG